MTLQPIDRQVFAASGTWHKNAQARTVRVQLLGGGGGGGGGARNAASALRVGGAAAAAGGYLESWYRAADLTDTVAVTIGTGGTGGIGAATDTTAGGNGWPGEPSRFGGYLVTTPPTTGISTPLVTGAGGGQIAAVAPAGLVHLGDKSANVPGQGQSSFNLQVGVSQSAFNQPAGGAAAGGAAADNSVRFAGDGINNVAMGDPNVQIGGSLGGGAVTPVASPKQLADVDWGTIPWYSGAAGGSTTGGATGSGASDGGSAQGYGAGGGGGGASTNGFTAGTGGRGAPGLCIVTSYR